MREELEEQKPNRVSRKLPCDGFIGTVPFLQEFTLKTSCRCSPWGLQQRAQIYCCRLAASTGRQLCSGPGGRWLRPPFPVLQLPGMALQS